MQIQAIVTDIEGTTSSIDFVHQVLFPYSAKALPEYIYQHYQVPEIAAIITEVRQEIAQPDAKLEQIITTLLNWIEADQKITPLKTLQGFIWEYGFKNQEFQSHLYEDAYRQLQQWFERGIKLYVFSSGSEKAQKLLFGYSEYGDLTYLFQDYFDTRIGNKKQSQAYQNIAAAININPQNILFLSDVIAELDAAKAVGYHTVLLARKELPQSKVSHSIASNFEQINLS
ncbi:MAG TPA: acireductone synthase [Xenococcaceae cyanobacterium]